MSDINAPTAADLERQVHYQLLLDLVKTYGRAFTVLEDSELVHQRPRTIPPENRESDWAQYVREDRHRSFLHTQYEAIHHGIARKASRDIQALHNCYQQLQRLDAHSTNPTIIQALVDHREIIAIFQNKVDTELIINEVRFIIGRVLATLRWQYDDMTEWVRHWATPDLDEYGDPLVDYFNTNEGDT